MERLKPAYLLLGLVLTFACDATLACDGLTSSSDPRGDPEVRQRLIAQNIEYRERFTNVKRHYASRFADRELPNGGCDVCPDMCRWADLGVIPPDRFQRMYRQAAILRVRVTDYDKTQMVWLEQWRLGCIMRRFEPEVRHALARELMSSAEPPAVRYVAALQSIEIARDHTDAPEERSMVEHAREVLDELARTSSAVQDDAAMTMSEWALGIEPEL